MSLSTLFGVTLWSPFDLSGGGPPLPDDLVDAIVALVQSTMVSTGQLTWFGSGEAPGWDEATLPYARILEFAEDAEYQSEDEAGSSPYDDRASIPIAVYASTAAAAKSLGKILSNALTDAPLAFDDGELLYLRRVSKSNPSIDPDDAPDGGDCWSVNLIFPAITAKST